MIRIMEAKHILYRRGRDIRPQELLEKSIEIYNWLDTYKAEEESGIYYEVNPGGAADYSDKPVHGKYGLYSGSSGTGFFQVFFSCVCMKRPVTKNI